MKARRIPVMLEVETDLTVAELRQAGKYVLRVFDARDVSRTVKVVQALPDAVRQRATTARKKEKRYRTHA